MNIRESAQDYMEAILILQEKNGIVKSVDIANFLSVTKQSVHRAIKNLSENEYISLNSKGHILLNAKGLEIANDIYNKHKVLAEFFMSIGVGEDVAFADACRIEHYISNESFDAIKNLMQSKK